MLKFHRLMGQVGALALVVLGVGVAARAAELTPVNIRMDFIIGGKHAPWYVALEKGFYAKRGLAATIQSSTGSADTVRTIGAGGADFGFADIATMIVAKSRGAVVQAAAQFGYVPRDHSLARRGRDHKASKIWQASRWRSAPAKRSGI